MQSITSKQSSLTEATEERWQHRNMIFKTRPTWIDVFAATMTKLDVRADPDHIVDLAEVMYEIHSDLDPGSVARAESDKWPEPHG